MLLLRACSHHISGLLVARVLQIALLDLTLAVIHNVFLDPCVLFQRLHRLLFDSSRTLSIACHVPYALAGSL